MTVPCFFNVRVYVLALNLLVLIGLKLFFKKVGRVLIGIRSLITWLNTQEDTESHKTPLHNTLRLQLAKPCSISLSDLLILW